jgi:MFS family permease
MTQWRDPMNSSAVSPGRAGLFLLLTGQMLPLIDTSIANVALDSITQSLNASATQLELIVALYGVAFAVCLAMGSKLGDNYGRRRLFMWGVAIFGVASCCAGWRTPSPRCWRRARSRAPARP